MAVSLPTADVDLGRHQQSTCGQTTVQMAFWPELTTPLDISAMVQIASRRLTFALPGRGGCPSAGIMNGVFGADVKINSPGEEGASYRWQVHRYHTDVNRGKRTILLDLKTPEGLEVFRRLVEDADIVLQNFRPGVAELLGVGYEQVRARKPDIVYGSVGFLGEGGPWESMPGYEPNAQAATGMMARMAGHHGPPAMQPFACNDYATGLLGAFALGLALFNRQVTGAGERRRHKARYQTPAPPSPRRRSGQPQGRPGPGRPDSLPRSPCSAHV
jgi:CoA-transferase family III